MRIWPWVGGQVDVAVPLLQVGTPKAVSTSGIAEPVPPLHDVSVSGMLPTRSPLPSSVNVPLDVGKVSTEPRPRPLA